MNKNRIIQGAVAILAGLIVLLIFRSCSGSSTEASQPATEEATAQTREAAVPHIIDAEYLSQVGLYPCGCESVSAVMALRYAGYEIDVDTFIGNYLPQGSEPYYEDDGLLYADSPYEVFIGSPYDDSGYGCYAPVIRKAIEHVIAGDESGDEMNAEPGKANRVADLTGSSLDELCRNYISRDIPVIVWGTIGMQPISGYTDWILPDGSEFTWRSQEHCLLLVGCDAEYYYFNDPMEEKNTKYPKADAEAAYAALYSQALAIVKE